MKYRVTHDGTTKTYATLFHTASFLLHRAKEEPEGSVLNLQGASVFYAFAFEAYLNHVGAEEITFWDEIDRMSYAKKLRIIEKHLNLTVDHGAHPFQVIQELFDLRNTLAHARTIAIDDSYETDTPPDHVSTWRIHDWEKLTPVKVSLYSTCVDAAIKTINQARPRPDDEFELWNQGIRGLTVEARE
jgi:hypothetical protein